MRRIISKFQYLYFLIKMKVYSFFKLPAQTEKERQIFKIVFNHVSVNGKLRVFEWGSGLSTLYYTKYLVQKGIDFEWHAIDNHKGWHEKVKLLLDEHKLSAQVTVHLMEFPPFWEKSQWGMLPPHSGVYAPRLENEKNYVDFPNLLGEFFDVIIVDARFRRSCIQTAKNSLSPNGIVILHDAQKPHYHPGLEVFPYGRFVNSGKWDPFQKEENQMWIGSIIKHPVFEKLKAL